MPVLHVGMYLFWSLFNPTSHRQPSSLPPKRRAKILIAFKQTALFKLKPDADVEKVKEWQKQAEEMVGQVPGKVFLPRSPCITIYLMVFPLEFFWSSSFHLSPLFIHYVLSCHFGSYHIVIIVVVQPNSSPHIPLPPFLSLPFPFLLSLFDYSPSKTLSS